MSSQTFTPSQCLRQEAWVSLKRLDEPRQCTVYGSFCRISTVWVVHTICQTFVWSFPECLSNKTQRLGVKGLHLNRNASQKKAFWLSYGSLYPMFNAFSTSLILVLILFSIMNVLWYYVHGTRHVSHLRMSLIPLSMYDHHQFIIPNYVLIAIDHFIRHHGTYPFYAASVAEHF